MTTEYLFVYGTLAPNQPNEQVLSQIPGYYLPAKVKGRLYAEGWGAALGYPAIVIDPQADWVEGFLYCSNQLPQHWQRLDEFEGAGYRRIKVQVQLENGDQQLANIYVLAAEEV